MPKNNKSEIKSINSESACVECKCGFKIEYKDQPSKAYIIMRLHNKICTSQTRGQYNIENVAQHIRIRYA